MTPAAILERLQALGVIVEPTSDPEHPILLRPADRIPVAMRPEIAALKTELAELISLAPSPAWQADPSRMPWPRPLGDDPRPDLKGSDLWSDLLLLASGDADDPRGVYGRLLGARACGAVLEWRAGRWRLAPTIDLTERLSVWANRADWEADAEKWLKPRAAEIVALLRQLPAPDGEAKA